MRHRPLASCLAALLLLAAIPALSQTRPAPLPDAPATNPALEAEFAQRQAALKPGDLTARLDLAHWAREQKLWTHAAALAHEILDHDPDNLAAWSILKQYDQAVPLPAEPDTEEALKQEFNRRFHREPAALNAFKTRYSQHFLLCYDTADTFAAQRGGFLEKAYDAFLFFFNMNQLRPSFLQKHLVVILFKTRDDYLAYAKATEGADLSWAAGYYSQRTNRTAFYDDSTGPAAESVEKKLDQLRARLKDLNTQIQTANDKNDHVLASNLYDERRRIAEALSQINLRVDNALVLMNAVKTVHEAAHQLAFNTGIQKRLVDYPLWFAEGLACSFEIEDRSGRRGPSIVNYGRAAVVKEAIKRGKNAGGLIPLEQFISQPQPPVMDENTLSVFYAEGWALFHYLYKNNRIGMEKYLLTYDAQLPLRQLSSDQRRKFFTDAFGDDIPALQTKFIAYLKDLPAKAP